ncbi:hypothetical protein GCM10027514_33270 [Azotobacter armeniacus]
MDNLGSRKVAGVRQAIEGAGATLRYLALQPRPQSDRDDISKLKALLRKAAARTVCHFQKATAPIHWVGRNVCRGLLNDTGH